MIAVVEGVVRLTDELASAAQKGDGISGRHAMIWLNMVMK